MAAIEDKLQRAMAPLEELVRPEHTAVLVIDMQNDDCYPEGWFGRAGADLSMIRASIADISTLVGEARKAGAMVIWVRGTSLVGRLGEAPAMLRRMTKQLPAKAVIEAPLGAEGTWGWHIIDELKPVSGEPIINKLRPSAFVGTYTDIVLSANDIKTIIVVGNTTSGCVLSTTFDGLQLGYFAVVPDDCVADFSQDKHDVGIGFLKMRVDLVASAEILAAWSKVKEPVSG